MIQKIAFRGDIGPERVLNWMDRNSLTQERTAHAIGVLCRVLNCYLLGAKPIPKTVWLACVEWAAVRRMSHNLRLWRGLADDEYARVPDPKGGLTSKPDYQCRTIHRPQQEN